MSPRTVKIVCDGDIRRFKMLENPNVGELKKHVTTCFGLKQFALLYKDEEGDVLRVRIDAELREAFLVAEAQNKVLKLTVSRDSTWDSPGGMERGSDDSPVELQSETPVDHEMEVGTHFFKPEGTCQEKLDQPNWQRRDLDSSSNSNSDSNVQHPLSSIRRFVRSGSEPTIDKSLAAPMDYKRTLRSEPPSSDGVADWRKTPRSSPGHARHTPSGGVLGALNSKTDGGISSRLVRPGPPVPSNVPPTSAVPLPSSEPLLPPIAAFRLHTSASCAPVDSLKEIPPSTSETCDSWRGATRTVAYKAKFVKDITLPDRSIVKPLQRLVKTWQIRNCGEKRWPQGTVCRLFRSCNGEVADPESRFPVRAAAPGEFVDVSVIIGTPTTRGRCRAFFRLATPENRFFGPRMWIDIRVHDKRPSKPSHVGTITGVDPAQALRLLAAALLSDPSGDDQSEVSENEREPAGSTTAADSSSGPARNSGFTSGSESSAGDSSERNQQRSDDEGKSSYYCDGTEALECDPPEQDPCFSFDMLRNDTEETADTADEIACHNVAATHESATIPGGDRGVDILKEYLLPEVGLLFA
eukprot:gb/GEZN01003216.1/.p1 GENE.gb/GEZN01003216.1/~~gb/GEZN01003216.1/.p1  ORF type:complete len:581 (+),score=63.57 gb/GEZN01003216.1/:276-2018(+)